MYFLNAGELQTHLNEDWTHLLKNIKTREDLHYQLLQYNRKIVMRRRLEEDQLFIKDQILQHQAEVAKVDSVEDGLEKEERAVREKYQGNVVGYEEIMKLMVRVGARIVQTYQASIDKCKAFDEELLEKFTKTKTTLVKLIHHKSEINLEEIVNLVLTYSKNKLGLELEKLKRLVVALENGQFSKLQEVYTFKQKRVVVPVVSVEKRKLSIEKVKVSSVGKDDRSPLRDQIKAQEKVKKQKQKIAVRMVHGLYSTMQLSKQYAEDICSDEREKTTRLYNEIFVRNKLNYEQIKAFEAKREDFHEKVRIFKEMMERESKRIEQAMQKEQKEEVHHDRHHEAKSAKNQVIKVHSQTTILQDLTCVEQEISSLRQIPANRYRIQSPKSKRNSKELNQSFTNPIPGNDQFSHFKFDASGQQVYARTNRRLPVIINNPNGNQSVNRATSLDHRVELNKTKIFRHHAKPEMPQDSSQETHRNEKIKERGEKNLQRTKIALKNIQLGARQELSGKQRKKFEPSPMEYTFFTRKSNQKFYQAKLNALI